MWFHVSKVDLGEHVTLLPQIPKLSPHSTECRETPRVCFSPTIEQCLSSLFGFGDIPSAHLMGYAVMSADSFKCPTIYTVDGVLIKPSPQADFHITDEHWATACISVTRLGYFDPITTMKYNMIMISSDPVTFR